MFSIVQNFYVVVELFYFQSIYWRWKLLFC